MSKPFLFIFFLILVLAFVLGFRYGQRVEKNNKAVDFMLSITPTRSPSPTPPIQYKDFKSKKWGLKFTYPANLEIKEDATAPAVLFKIK